MARDAYPDPREVPAWLRRIVSVYDLRGFRTVGKARKWVRGWRNFQLSLGGDPGGRVAYASLMDGERPTVVRLAGKTVVVVQDTAGDWRVLIPGWDAMAPFTSKFEAVAYAKEWLLARL